MDREMPNPQGVCSKCHQNSSVTICSGCQQLFCFKHKDQHRKDLQQQLKKAQQGCVILQQEFDQQKTKAELLNQIKQWETDAVSAVQRSAQTARSELEELIRQSNKRLSSLVNQFSEAIKSAEKNDNITENEIKSLQKQLQDFHQELNKLSQIKLIDHNVASLALLKIASPDTERHDTPPVSTPQTTSIEEKQSAVAVSRKMSQGDTLETPRSDATPNSIPPRVFPSSTYPSITFGLHESTPEDIQRLFKKLMLLSPMDKDGPMSGKCDIQTSQMEQFLEKTFGFKNIPGEVIVQGVRSFQLRHYPHKMQDDRAIYFPQMLDKSFQMTIPEIVEWQRSYKVYADRRVQGMTKEFLKKALQGKSGDGEEAFRMKFVVRISTCPILMEFDAKVISRQLKEDWPNKIKLVSVTGIDFAGRKHDVEDILYYIPNWKDVFEVDCTGKKPAQLNERDFARKRGGPVANLSETRLFNDLKYMASLRLQACDREGVQIVVETGIGLGVFSGRHIGIEEKVRTVSAIAVRTVLEEEGPKYQNIRAVVFALPIFARGTSNGDVHETFHTFVDQFQEPQYTGRIPVLIADQDMHRLTVAIARQGFIVSELNPADSHGVFGEYWQNRGPAVEEKLALTTLGLLVQHHLINPQVLNTNNYQIV